MTIGPTDPEIISLKEFIKNKKLTQAKQPVPQAC